MAEVWGRVSMDLLNITEIRDELIEKRNLLFKQTEDFVNKSDKFETQDSPKDDVILFHKSETETIEIPNNIFKKYQETVQLEQIGKSLQIFADFIQKKEIHQKCIQTQNIEKAMEILQEMITNLSKQTELDLKWLEMIETTTVIFRNCIQSSWDQTSDKFTEIINQIKFPFHSDSNIIIEKTKSIHLAINYSHLSDIHSISKKVGTLNYPHPMFFLTQTLRKRFVYHFTGDKESNNINKPEWCFKQVFKWIEINSKFIETELVDIISENANVNYRNFMKDFITEICKFVVFKVEKSLIQIEELPIAKGVNLFGHWVDEIIEFEDNLEEIGFIAKRGNNESCIEILENERNIPKMLEMEQNISDMIQKNFDKNLENFETNWAFELLVEIKAMQCRGEKIGHPNYKLQTVGIIQDFLNEVCEKVREKFSEIKVWKFSMNQVVILLNGVTVLIENMQKMQEEPFFLKIASNAISQENQSQILDDVISNSNCLVTQIIQSIQNYTTTLILNSANEYSSLEWIQNLPPFDDIISLDIPKSFFHLLGCINSTMERIVDINSAARTQILLHSFDELDKYLYETIFLEKFPNSNLFSNIVFHIQKYLFTLNSKYKIQVNNTFPRLHDVISIFARTEVELSLILRDINTENDWSVEKSFNVKRIDINRKYTILYLDSEDIKFLVTQRMNQMNVIYN